MATVQQTSIPGYAKTMMIIAFVFMPIFLILPFFFWGNTDTSVDIDRTNLIEARILPVGKLNVGEAAPAAASGTETAAAFDPQQTYDSVCAACHATTALGAPVFGNHDDWQARLDKAGSLDALVTSGTNGVGAMPPKGGAPISDEQFHDMVVFMLDHAEVSH